MALRLPFERLLSFLVPIQLEVMAPRGLELVFQCALPSITTKQDVLVVFVHWKLISKGFLCLGVGTEPALKPEDGTELLPTNWNESHEIYELHYSKDGKLYLMKAVFIDEQLIINIARITDEHVSTITLECAALIGDNFKVFNQAFIDSNALDEHLEKELMQLILAEKNKEAAATATKASQARPQVDPLIVGRPRIPQSRWGEGYGEIDPFAVGGGDLHPFGRGGMLMDPRHQIYPGLRPGEPPGNPLGARFYPYGPNPQGPFPPRGPFAPGRPGNAFGEPDPDHLPPPGSHDMFM